MSSMYRLHSSTQQPSQQQGAPAAAPSGPLTIERREAADRTHFIRYVIRRGERVVGHHSVHALEDHADVPAVLLALYDRGAPAGACGPHLTLPHRAPGGAASLTPQRRRLRLEH